MVVSFGSRPSSGCASRTGGEDPIETRLNSFIRQSPCRIQSQSNPTKKSCVDPLVYIRIGVAALRECCRCFYPLPPKKGKVTMEGPNTNNSRTNDLLLSAVWFGGTTLLTLYYYWNNGNDDDAPFERDVWYRLYDRLSFHEIPTEPSANLEPSPAPHFDGHVLLP